ncbi:L-serine ammonia-lyase [Acidovorax sp. SUPP3334]|uniref:L-serine ammonia-lyase n=1 Tax=Acidovorax sp. SUPP3334 TaxID=2920881 RepID=UPI0023DE348B|nr:L-serine ammonia-lyase [Acidovorax sp. SUPP3334]GKT25890.1 L-serine ammonia-lyase [Acidovorax sp. SUPP3334]
MSVSVFDLFKIGIGPSSSHTVGPMIAARQFAVALQQAVGFGPVHRVGAELFGSLAATGVGHGTDRAVLLGLAGHEPDRIEPDRIGPTVEAIRSGRCLDLLGSHRIAFNEKEHLLFRRKSLPFHPNGLSFHAHDAQGEVLLTRTYYSVGGGFVVDEAGQRVLNSVAAMEPAALGSGAGLPHPYRTGAELLAQCAATGQGIAAITLANEGHWHSSAEVRQRLLRIWQTMAGAVQRGCASQGSLPGPMRLQRRAGLLHQTLSGRAEEALRDPLSMLDWINLYAMAVNEENAAGGRVVTAPTNGAAGVIPAVLHYYVKFVPGADEDGIADFLLTAGAIGIIYKENASLSGAEVGCQGEVGVACSMAAGALAAVMGGTPAQVENAAEIGMEHNLGMTCDPVGGLVQIPCIERNAMGAIKAINATRMALRGNGTHMVSLDQVIKTMMQTGADMKSKYKETSRGGLAVNVVEC